MKLVGDLGDRVIRLYAPVKVIGMSFKGVKRTAQPNQSMSLHEIIRRFIRRESLPVSKEGTYEERFGDLEKLSKQDITVQMERVEELRVQLLDMEKRIRSKQDADSKAKKDALDDAILAALPKPTPTPPAQPVSG